MTLNKKEIEDFGIIDDINKTHLRNASYDMSTESIIDMKGNKHDFYKLPPQGMAIVVFKEKIKLSENIIGFAHVKTSLTQKGIMATNIGIIDPGYNGFLSTLLINFGNDTHSLHKGEAYLRLTFNKINDEYQSDNSKLVQFPDYLKSRQSDTDNLSEKFLNLSSVNNEVFNKVMKSLIGLGIIFSAASFAIGMYFQNKTANEKDQDKVLKSYDIQNTLLLNQNKKLQLTLDSVNVSLKNTELRIRELEKKK